MIRLDMGKMGSFLWFSMCVVFPFVSPAMSMRGVKGTSAALSATPAISATKVNIAHDHWFFYFIVVVIVRTSFVFWKK